MFNYLLLVIALLAGDQQARAAVDVQTLSGQSAYGSLTSLDSDHVELVAADGEQLRFDTEDLLQLNVVASTDAADQVGDAPTVEGESHVAGRALVKLVDGTRVYVTGVAIQNRVISAVMEINEQEIAVPTADVAAIKLASNSPEAEVLWQELRGRELDGDVLMVHKRGGASVDYLTGVVGDLDAEKLIFEWDGEQVPVKLAKIAGVGFYHARKIQLPQQVGAIRLHSDELIQASSVRLLDDKLQLTTRTGLDIEIPWKLVRSIDFSAGKVVFLDDLQPLRQRWTPQIELPHSAAALREFGMPRRNRSFLGSALTLHWEDDASGLVVRTYARGLALRSRTELEYAVPQDMERFTAVAGIDPDCISQGQVQVDISLDGRLASRFEVDGQTPVEIDVQLESARRLGILVDFGENLGFGDRVHLVNAKITK